MKKIIILIPVFNDWESLIKLINEINGNIKDYKNINFECLVVNDASTINQPELIKPNNLKSLQILNMKENRGHARCNAFGIGYIFKNKEFDNLILMDGDGEDRPVEIKSLVDKAIKKKNLSVVAKRVKRSEGSFFQLLYKIHKIITCFKESFQFPRDLFQQIFCKIRKILLVMKKKLTPKISTIKF